MSAIHHIVPRAELESGLGVRGYTPARFAIDGFVHCTSEPAVTLCVARDYFAGHEGDLLVLRIDPASLTSEVRYEAPAPLAGGRAHLVEARLFPHVYGPIDRAAIVAVAVLGATWPTVWRSLDDVTDTGSPK